MFKNSKIVTTLDEEGIKYYSTTHQLIVNFKTKMGLTDKLKFKKFFTEEEQHFIKSIPYNNEVCKQIKITKLNAKQIFMYDKIGKFLNKINNKDSVESFNIENNE